VGSLPSQRFPVKYRLVAEDVRPECRVSDHRDLITRASVSQPSSAVACTAETSGKASYYNKALKRARLPKSMHGFLRAYRSSDKSLSMLISTATADFGSLAGRHLPGA